MSRHDWRRRSSRRTFLKAGGAALGGLALSTGPASAGNADRYLVRLKRGANLGPVTVEENLPGVDYAAVSGQEKHVKRIAKQYAPDPVLEQNVPAIDAQVPADAADARDEPLYPLQWGKQDLNVPTAQNVSLGEDVRVAVIDSGIAAEHPDIDEVNLDLSENFSGDGQGVGYPYGGYHGTHVAGIIAATASNELGIVGTAPKAELVDCRVFPYGEGAPFSVILAALLHSIEVDADIANLSLGGYAPRQEYVDGGAFGRFYGRALNKTLTTAYREGTLVVMSAGNNGADLQHDRQWISLPNEGAQGLSISATGPVGFNWGEPGLREPFHTPAVYTNYGTNAIDLAAPGGNTSAEILAMDPADRPAGWYYDLVLSTVANFERNEAGEITGEPSYGWGWAAGTSMAAPNVSGAAALLKATDPGLKPQQLDSILRRTAEVPPEYDKTYYGSGYLDILDALEAAGHGGSAGGGSGKGRGS